MMIKRFFSRLLSINIALLTVLTFFIASLVGASALTFTERNRTVYGVEPYTREVNISGKSTEGTETYEAIETHTFTKPIEYKGEKFIDMWFTSVSALCVTGLTSTDFSQFTPAGQFITMLLIQMGGLGIIVFTSIFAFGVFRGLSERLPARKLLASAMDSAHHDVTDMLKFVAGYTLLFELGAALIMGLYLWMQGNTSALSGHNPFWWGLFHSVSAFNNAGFGLNNNNLASFPTDPLINFVISTLIIVGGLGYPVLIAGYFYVRKYLPWKQSRIESDNLKQDISGVASLVQIKVALFGTFLLLVLGTVIPFVVEYNNPIFEGYSITQKLTISYFQSVSTRTAGFNTIDIGALHIATLFLYIILMIIGANPAGTAGGIKIPTVGVLYGYIKDWFMAPGQPVILFNRRISKFALSHAVRLFFFSVIFIATIVFLISLIESKYLLTPDSMFNFQKVLFEVASAFGTVGLSMGYSGGVTSFSGILSNASKLLIILTMFFGRIGPLTFLAALPWKRATDHLPESPDFENSDKMQIG